MAVVGESQIADWMAEAQRVEAKDILLELSAMTLNMQYYASYPKDEEVARARLAAVTEGTDIICVQEGIAGRNVLDPVGYELCVCAGQSKIAQSVDDMVYGDASTLKNCDGSVHDKLLCNQIYLRRGSSWEVFESGAVQVSSNLRLSGGESRAEGDLAIRSLVWVKLRKTGTSGPVVYMMCTHTSGGRFEDQYFVQQLAEERFQQTERIMDFFNQRSDPREDDVGILLGDFNATTEYTEDGPMHSYFKSGILTSPGVQADAAAEGLDSKQLSERFKKYMISPFAAIQKHGWTLAYNQEQVGVTSGFGHLIDHMVMSRPLNVISAKVIFLTNQKIGNKTRDTDLPLTDHNAVKTTFGILASDAKPKGTDLPLTDDNSSDPSYASYAPLWAATLLCVAGTLLCVAARAA